jgi:plasmid stability protein
MRRRSRWLMKLYPNPPPFASGEGWELAAYFHSRDIGRIWRAERLEYGITGIIGGVVVLSGDRWLCGRVDIMMARRQHQDMRTTLTLDDDLAAKLKAESRRAGRSLRDTVNEALRRGLASQRVTAQRPPIKLRVRDLGGLKPGLSLDNVADLIERAEGPIYR